MDCHGDDPEGQKKCASVRTPHIEAEALDCPVYITVALRMLC